MDRNSEQYLENRKFLEEWYSDSTEVQIDAMASDEKYMEEFRERMAFMASSISPMVHKDYKGKRWLESLLK